MVPPPPPPPRTRPPKAPSFNNARFRKLPKETLYVHNLNERVKPGMMRQALKSLFAPYGTLLRIQIRKVHFLRGQAFITFAHTWQAAAALERLNGFPLFFKPMHIQYARDQNYAISERDGTVDVHRERRQRNMAKRGPRRILKAAERAAIKERRAREAAEEALPPNAILFTAAPPPLSTREALEALFGQYPGLVEVRLVPGKQDIAFVEYDSEHASTVARTALHKTHLGGEVIRVTFAKR
ncbi:hypothetical protein CXG81DRAFT_10032 [Caulochytrium protostelioides]|uniref:RRM domain-containing protein n=1 Tax=Caulochytrium protostelioides TaxID=1555241 RepID=A0A4P9XC79_9FUNG|nr:hypothetical protein CXG81DRAFT_10032 [Caulochytrium protostelioides]|eukprot:RKP03025.1 hypothetical protein CXG81DRAFT_10032 [Caulochytrium protostelioides]